MKTTVAGAAWSRRPAVRLGAMLIGLAVLALAPAGASATGWTSSNSSSASRRSAGVCQAVGSCSNASGGIFTPWARGGLSGDPWSREANRYVFAGATFDAVSCATVTDCRAVGRYADFFDEALLLGEYWNGSTWEIADVPTSGVLAQLRAVASPTTDEAEVVGSSAPSSGQAIAEERTFPLFQCRRGFAAHSFSLGVRGPEGDGAPITAVLPRRTSPTEGSYP